jgi:hypothetical protein
MKRKNSEAQITDMTRFPISIRSLLWLMVAVALVLSFAIDRNRRFTNRICNSYRLQAMGDILVDYLESRDEWPEDWNQLRQFVESNGNALHGVRTFSELQANLIIDFSFEPASAMDGSQDGLHSMLVVARDGSREGATRSPDVTIYRYLQEKRKK